MSKTFKDLTLKEAEKYWKALIDISLFKEWSDIDIAVLGIPNSLYFKAVAEVISLDEEFEVDLVDIESCSENLKM